MKRKDQRFVVEAEVQERDTRSRIFLIIDTVKKEVLEKFYYTRRNAEQAARHLNKTGPK